MKQLALPLLLFSLAWPATAQRDFLTSDEADQLRLAQEPDERLRLYVLFARQRVDMLDQFFAKKQTGRSGMIHQTLEQYTSIIDAIDTVIDDMLRKNKEIKTLETVSRAEKDMLGKLEKFAEDESPDSERWKFALEQAIETTRDSAELAELDLKERKHNVEVKASDERKRNQEMMTPQRRAEMEKEAAKTEQAAKDSGKAKKQPSLLRKGETIKK
jgi:hypothetical protein